MASVTLDLGVDGDITYFDVDDTIIDEIAKLLEGYDYSQRV